jgi:pimeloyl-ACP methyl ester carboxylesterase
MTRRRLLLAAALLTLSGVLLLAMNPRWLLQAEFARLRHLAGAQVRSSQVAAHQWAWLEAGDPARPLLVLVHGFTGSKENWLPLMRRLAKTHHVIAPDLPGWGESERQHSAGYGPGAQVERLSAFLQTLPKKPALLVGHSMGGQISGLLAARHPGRIERLMLMSSAGVEFQENEFGRAVVLEKKNPFEVKSRAELRRYLDIVFSGNPPFLPWPADLALVKQRRADAAFEQQVLDAIGRGPEAFALEAELPRIEAMTLLLWCRDDRVIDISAEAIFHRGLPRSRSVILAGCGHMPMMAQPDNVATALRDFLAAPL